MNEIDLDNISGIHRMSVMQNVPDPELAELLLLEKTLYPLDLASKYSVFNFKKWSQKLQKNILRSFHLDIVQFKEEAKVSVSAAMNLHADAIRALEREYREHYTEIVRKRWFRQMQFFHEFEAKLFKNIIVMDRISKKAAILRYLDLAKTLQLFNSQDKFVEVGVMYHFLSSTLFDHFREDAELLITLFQKLCATNSLKTLVLHNIRDDLVLDYILFNAQKMDFDFWGVWRNTGFLSKIYSPVAKMLRLRKFESVKTLLDYGFHYSFDAESYRDRCDVLRLVRSNGEPIIDDYGVRRFLRMGQKPRIMMMTEIFLLFKNGFCSSFYNALVLITRSSPEPFITPQELYDKLSLIFFSSAIDELSQLCVEFQELGIGDYEDDFSFEYRPRKLIHLSRCAVRQILSKNLKLPNGIDCLDLPSSLKNYLKLKS